MCLLDGLLACAVCSDHELFVTYHMLARMNVCTLCYFLQSRFVSVSKWSVVSRRSAQGVGVDLWLRLCFTVLVASTATLARGDLGKVRVRHLKHSGLLESLAAPHYNNTPSLKDYLDAHVIEALEEADGSTDNIQYRATYCAVGATESKPQAAYRCCLSPNTTLKGHLL
jgi:hypothetical protein